MTLLKATSLQFLFTRSGYSGENHKIWGLSDRTMVIVCVVLYFESVVVEQRGIGRWSSAVSTASTTMSLDEECVMMDEHRALTLFVAVTTSTTGRPDKGYADLYHEYGSTV